MNNRSFRLARHPILALTCVTLLCCYLSFLYQFQLTLSGASSQVLLHDASPITWMSYLLGGVPVTEHEGGLFVQQITEQSWLPLHTLVQQTATYALGPIVLLLFLSLAAVVLSRAYATRCQVDVLSPIARVADEATPTCRAPSQNLAKRTPASLQHEVLDAIQRIRAKSVMLESEAFTDKLTGLYDRHAFLDTLAASLDLSKEQQQPLAVLFIDLDGFKQVNDSFGHSIGDEVLAKISHRLLMQLSKGIEGTSIEPLYPEHLARLGGDEFALMIQGREAKADAVTVAGELLDVIEEEIIIGHKSIHISASIGIASYPESASRPELLLQMADVAMYRAKTDGKGIYRIYSSEMGSRVRRYHYLLEEMRLGIRDSSFTLNFQPIIKVSSCQVSCFEALLRWEHSQEGNIPPTEFIPIAEESGLILDIGDWVLREACTQMHRWYEAGMKKVRVSVNVSPVQVKRRNLYQWVMGELSRTQLPPTALTLEITESCLLDANADVLDQINQLRAVGVYIAIDDFGTGFSSLSMLATLPIDVLKVDRSFVSQARDSAKHRKILISIAELAKKLGLTVVAEGVEHTEELVIMQEMGIDSIQGFLISRPQPPKHVDRKVLYGDGISQVATMGTRIWTPGT